MYDNPAQRVDGGILEDSGVHSDACARRGNVVEKVLAIRVGIITGGFRKGPTGVILGALRFEVSIPEPIQNPRVVQLQYHHGIKAAKPHLASFLEPGSIMAP